MKHKKKLDKGRNEPQSTKPRNSHSQIGSNSRTIDARGFVDKRFTLTSILVLLVALGTSLAINAGYDARWASRWILSKFTTYREPIVTLGGVDVHGYFPKGCIWRPVQSSSSAEKEETDQKKSNKRADTWRVRQYEYWNRNSQNWSSKRPLECEIESEEVAKLGQRKPSSWETKIQTDKNYTVLRNLWYNNGVFYSLQKQNREKSSFELTSNMDCNRLVVEDHKSFVSNIDAHYVTGESLLIDFVYFIHPTAIGHWLEHLLPLISARRLEGQKTAPDRIMIMHLKRSHVFEWVRAALASAFGLQGLHLPPLIFQEEVYSVWDQIGTRFEGVPKTRWICFEKVIMTQDIVLGGKKTAFSTQDARSFRERMHRIYGNTLSGANKDKKIRITLLHKSANRRILNKDAVINLLSTYGDVDEVEFTENITMIEQLKKMAGTKILVSTHTSGLANSVFLPPGAAVIELNHRNWVWDNLDKSFLIQTRMLGDVHHFTWRARTKAEGPYINPNDERRFGSDAWTNEKCDTEECVEAHTNIDVVVNIQALKRLLDKEVSRAINIQ
eukprot:jgi/Picsp_1/4644/NSC_02014-R1_uncharacterized glycosyltransferase aer61-like isoform 1